MWRIVNGFVFFLNVIAFFIGLIAFAIPYVAPSKFPVISILSLGIPILILGHILFVIYWIIFRKKRFIFSFLILLGIFLFFPGIYKFSSGNSDEKPENSLSILSYNVRLFNAYEKKDHGDVPKMMKDLFQNEDPDVVMIQEYFRNNKVDFSQYPHNFIHFRQKESKVGYAIFSKYPLINTGSFDFKNSGNNTIYADLIKGKDTIRLYNMHLQSHGIIPEVQFLQETDKERLFKRLAKRFVQQENQIAAILAHTRKTSLPVVIGGDLNNTQFSYNYRKLKSGLNDAFREKGKGFGATFYFDHFPLRIDFIFASPELQVSSFKTMKKTYSDHHAIKTVIKL